jgi:hypothetical protein
MYSKIESFFKEKFFYFLYFSYMLLFFWWPKYHSQYNDYGLDGPGIKSHWGRDFLCLSKLAPRPISLCAAGTGSLPGINWPRSGANHPSPFSAKVGNGFELYLKLLSVPLCLHWHVMG